MEGDDTFNDTKISSLTKLILVIVIALVSVFFYYGITAFIFGKDFWLQSLVGVKK